MGNLVRGEELSVGKEERGEKRVERRSVRRERNEGKERDNVFRYGERRVWGGGARLKGGDERRVRVRREQRRRKRNRGLVGKGLGQLDNVEVGQLRRR